jgi:hypothetical protein
MIAWMHPGSIGAVDFTCGYCSREVSSNSGWLAQNPDRGQPYAGSLAAYDAFWIALCPRCGNPTYLKGALQIPAVPFGDAVQHLPEDIAALYREARDSVGLGNFTAGIMVGRKLLMNVAVRKGAAVGQNFAAFVDHLANTHVITPDMKPWVDEIRKLGNEANHEIAEISQTQAQDLITFLGMLLKSCMSIRVGIKRPWLPKQPQALLSRSAQRLSGSNRVNPQVVALGGQ